MFRDVLLPNSSYYLHDASVESRSLVISLTRSQASSSLAPYPHPLSDRREDYVGRRLELNTTTEARGLVAQGLAKKYHQTVSVGASPGDRNRRPWLHCSGKKEGALD
ncbi:hypothetical protein AN958_08995 [Leucoagaricus sp. SymC.cos]|nr:hypothetical protein AN958_08995 [Leucoagaricus sp. SymC.cos]